MKTLVLDTSNKYLVIALYQDGHCLEAIQETGSKQQSEKTIPYLQKLLDQQQWSLFDIDELIVTQGPGSYTGERIALTIVKTLKTVHPFKVKVMSSLLAYAGKQRRISVLDARSKKVYVGIYDQGQALVADGLVAIDQFDAYVAPFLDFSFVGDTDLVNKKGQEVVIYQQMYELRDVAVAIEDIHQLTPSYIKEVEAKQLW